MQDESASVCPGCIVLPTVAIKHRAVREESSDVIALWSAAGSSKLWLRTLEQLSALLRGNRRLGDFTGSLAKHAAQKLGQLQVPAVGF